MREIAVLQDNHAITALASHRGDLYVGTTGGLYRLRGDPTHGTLELVQQGSVYALGFHMGRLFASSGPHLYEIDEA